MEHQIIHHQPLRPHDRAPKRPPVQSNPLIANVNNNNSSSNNNNKLVLKREAATLDIVYHNQGQLRANSNDPSALAITSSEKGATGCITTTTAPATTTTSSVATGVSPSLEQLDYYAAATGAPAHSTSVGQPAQRQNSSQLGGGPASDCCDQPGGASSQSDYYSSEESPIVAKGTTSHLSTTKPAWPTAASLIQPPHRMASQSPQAAPMVAQSPGLATGHPSQFQNHQYSVSIQQQQQQQQQNSQPLQHVQHHHHHNNSNSQHHHINLHHHHQPPQALQQVPTSPSQSISPYQTNYGQPQPRQQQQQAIMQNGYSNASQQQAHMPIAQQHHYSGAAPTGTVSAATPDRAPLHQPLKQAHDNHYNPSNHFQNSQHHLLQQQQQQQQQQQPPQHHHQQHHHHQHHHHLNQHQYGVSGATLAAEAHPIEHANHFQASEQGQLHQQAPYGMGSLVGVGAHNQHHHHHHQHQHQHPASQLSLPVAPVEPASLELYPNTMHQHHQHHQHQHQLPAHQLAHMGYYHSPRAGHNNHLQHHHHNAVITNQQQHQHHQHHHQQQHAQRYQQYHNQPAHQLLRPAMITPPRVDSTLLAPVVTTSPRIEPVNSTRPDSLTQSPHALEQVDHLKQAKSPLNQLHQQCANLLEEQQQQLRISNAILSKEGTELSANTEGNISSAAMPNAAMLVSTTKTSVSTTSIGDTNNNNNNNNTSNDSNISTTAIPTTTTTTAGAISTNTTSSDGGANNSNNNSNNNNNTNGSRSKRLRTSFKHHQLKEMKRYFSTNQNPDANNLKTLAQTTGLSKRVLQVWFQNARAKHRRNTARLASQQLFNVVNQHTMLQRHHQQHHQLQTYQHHPTHNHQH